MDFVDVILLVHDDHGHPLVCCKNHPGVVLFEFCEGSALGWVEVTLFVVWLLEFLRSLYTSDLRSSASWVGNLLAACSVEAMYASMGGYLGMMA